MTDKKLEEQTDEEIRRSIEISLFELNLFLRLASLRGFPVMLDLVERLNEEHPEGYTSVVASGIGAPPDQ